MLQRFAFVALTITTLFVLGGCGWIRQSSTETATPMSPAPSLRGFGL